MDARHIEEGPSLILHSSHSQNGVMNGEAVLCMLIRLPAMRVLLVISDAIRLLWIHELPKEE